MFSLFKDRIFLRNLGWLAIPIIINEMLNSLINMMDTFMTGKLGAASVTAIGLGNQVFFLFSLITFELSTIIFLISLEEFTTFSTMEL